jgi:hypothetical protein
VAICAVIGIVVVVVMWPLSLWGHAIHLTPSWHQLMHRNKAWMHAHYPLVGLRYVAAAALLALVTGAPIAAIAIPAARDRRERAAWAAKQRARQAELAHQAWLAGPPPPLTMPGRFTQNWITENVPHLHPGQVPELLREMRARGWTDARIEQRVRPYLP